MPHLSVPLVHYRRSPLLQNINYLRENKLIKSLIIAKFPNHPKRKETTVPLVNDSHLGNTQLGSRLVL